MKTHSRLPVIIALFQTVQFATMGIWVRMMQESFTTYQQVYIRILIASILGWVIFAKVIKPRQIMKYSAQQHLTYLLRAVFVFGVGVLLFTVAIQKTEFATVSFIASLPTLGIFAWLIFRERLDKGSLVYVLISIIGLALLTGINFTNFHLGVGETAAVISMVGFNIGYLLSRKHPASSNKYQDAVIVLSYGWIVPFLAVLAAGKGLWPQHITTVAWVGLIASVITNISGMVMVNYIFAHMKAYIAGNIFLLEGVIALVIGIFLYSETPSWQAIVGAMIIVACAYMVAKRDRGGRTIAGED
ncbi:EamA family transporter [Candidatus Saccharibacteria bacterium]|nr:MAG: EamA family transporter [Candidatus Saccharibacteria bacterium]